MPKSNVTPYTTPTARSKIGTKVHQSLLALAAVALVLTIACGGSDEAGDRSTTTTREPSTAVEQTTTTTTEDAVRSAYSAYVAMLERVITTSVDANDPELATRMVDPLLGDVRTQLSTWQAEGQVWVAGDETRHDIESVTLGEDMRTAVVTDCVVANDALVPAGSADVTLPAPSTILGHTTMVNRDGVWLAQDTDPEQRWEGVAGCAV
jgi:hypothetical protein